MAENESGWKPSERLQKLAAEKGVKIAEPTSEFVEGERFVTVEAGSDEIERLREAKRKMMEVVPETVEKTQSLTEEEKKKKTGITDDLNLLLREVPKEIRSNPNLNSEYSQSVNEARSRLNSQNINLDAFLRKDLVIKGPDDLKELGSRKATLRGLVAKITEGQELNEEEQNIADLVNIKKEEIFIPTEEVVVEKTEEPKEISVNSWDSALLTINSMRDPNLRREMRARWVQDHLDDKNIPFSVLSEQTERLNQDFENRTNNQNRDSVENRSVEHVDNNERGFTEEEQILIIQNCFDQVFQYGKNNSYEVKKALLGGEGYIAVNITEGQEKPLDRELLKKIDELGLDNWIAMKNMVQYWSSFKDVDEIKPSSLTIKLFMDENTEKFFANSISILPFINRLTGETELKEVNLGDEIGMAMKKLRGYFEGSLDFEGNSISEDRQKGPIEYWRLIGADLAEKEKLYTDLGLNRYIGEAAFSLLLSYQMLTDTSADDYLSMMVQQSKSRIKKYTVSEDRDAFVRMLVQSDIAEKKLPFVAYSGEELKMKKREMEERLSKLLPNQLVPTGLSGEGRAHLMAGNWLKWRVNQNLFTRTQLDTAKARNGEVRPATDQGTRLDMMRTALTMLTLIKEVQDPSSDVTKLASLTGRLYSHMKSSFGDANWLIKNGDNLMVPAAFSLKDKDGQLRDMELREWVSRTMLGVDETFLYTHSIVDHKNTKPWDMWTFAKSAEQLFRMEVQSGKGSFVGMSKDKLVEHRRELMKFTDRLWNNSFDLIDKLRSQANPSRYPAWYRQGTSAMEGAFEAAQKSGGALSVWNRTKGNIK